MVIWRLWNDRRNGGGLLSAASGGRSALESRATLRRIRFGHLLAIVGEHFERMGAVLYGADDVAVHAVAIVARIVGRDEIAVVVGLAVQLASERAAGQWSGRRDLRQLGDVPGVAIVPDRAADGVE